MKAEVVDRTNSREDTIVLAADDSSASGPGNVVGNILSLGAGELVSRFVAFFGTAYLARTLEPSGFGIIGFATALFSYFQLLVAAGFHDVGAREVARRPRRASSIAASVILVRFTLAVAALAVLSIVAWSVDKPATVKLILILTGLSIFSLALDTSWVYKGLERNRLPGIALILAQALFVGAVLLFVHGPADVTRVPLAQFFGEMGAALLLAIPLFRPGLRRSEQENGIKIDLREGWEVFCSSWSLAITRLLRTLIFTFSVVLVGVILGERQVGLFTAPYRICFLVLSLATVIQVSYLPAITRAATKGSGQVTTTTERAVHLAIAIAAPMVIGGIAIATPLLKAVFGVGYLEGVPAFQLLLVSIGCSFIFGSIHNVLLAYDRLKVELKIMVICAVLNVTFNLVAIPRYGLVGAGAATVLSEIVGVVLGWAAIYQLGVSLAWRKLWQPLFAAGIMGSGLIALGNDRSLILYLAAGTLIYIISLSVLRGIPQEVELLIRHIASNIKVVLFNRIFS